MITMTCRQVGGKCDMAIHASTYEEMVKKMKVHSKSKHPDIATKLSTMSEEDRIHWDSYFFKSWYRARTMSMSGK